LKSIDTSLKPYCERSHKLDARANIGFVLSSSAKDTQLLLLLFADLDFSYAVKSQ